MERSIETKREIAIVKERDLKNAPVTPVKKASGAKTTIVLNEEPRIALKISLMELPTTLFASSFLIAK